MILLAPMEGLLDFTLRDVLTRVGGVDRCVSEFIRVTGTLLPNRAFYRVLPELHNGGRTPAGVPVRAQLLGSDPVCLAENAAKLAALGPAGIDLNFGCPAKVVNRHGGGAALLQDPELVARIVSAVRRAVPADVPVSAKMRLGFNDDSLAEVCAQAIADAGATEIVVHARTKAQAYHPPAHWHRVNDLRRLVPIPVIVNGEIWNAQDAAEARAASGCHALMVGRGMVVNPGLALSIRNPDAPPVPWQALQPLMLLFWGLVTGNVQAKHRAGRVKQWLNFLRRRYPEAQALYDVLRTVNDPERVTALLKEHLPLSAALPGAIGTQTSLAS